MEYTLTCTSNIPPDNSSLLLAWGSFRNACTNAGGTLEYIELSAQSTLPTVYTIDDLVIVWGLMTVAATAAYVVKKSVKAIKP